MKHKLTATIAALLALTMAFALGACGASQSNKDDQYGAVKEKAKQQKAYLPKNDVELRNYNDAQKLYDSPDTIIWCTTTWGNANAPLVTTPVTGKLTSSSTTFFNPVEMWEKGETGMLAVPSRSVDGLYHPDPPKYRYGFTPGGQYVDFFEMPTYCTTALTKFQRESTQVTVDVDPTGANAQRAAEEALAAGDKQRAQDILANLEGDGG